MKTSATQDEVVGILKDQQALSHVVDDLWEAGFPIHDISVQGEPEALQAVVGKPYVDPQLIADNPKAPRQEPRSAEEFGWLLTFSILIPLLVGTLLGTVIASGIEPAMAVIIQGFIGGTVVGAFVGIALAMMLKLRHDQRIEKQIAKGGFVLWVNADTTFKRDKAKLILQKDGAYAIHDFVRVRSEE